jgi:hypothetical protein
MPATQDPNPPPPEPEKTPEQAEAEFWGKHKEHTLGVLDEWFEKKKTEFQGRSTGRTGRATLPGILADIMFGPAKEK